MSELKKELSRIQKNLKAPKNQRNQFGNYNYRSCEDILEAVKKELLNSVLTISDDVVQVGDRIYVKATSTLSLGDESISATAFAREPLTQKGMQDPQITGSASSYARKYSLNGLFCIDDTKDPDATNQGDSGNSAPTNAYSGNPGDYVCQFGKKYKGQAIKDIIQHDLVSYCTYLSNTAKEKNEDLSGPAKELVDQARLYLKTKKVEK